MESFMQTHFFHDLVGKVGRTGKPSSSAAEKDAGSVSECNDQSLIALDAADTSGNSSCYFMEGFFQIDHKVTILRDICRFQEAAHPFKGTVGEKCFKLFFQLFFTVAGERIKENGNSVPPFRDPVKLFGDQGENSGPKEGWASSLALILSLNSTMVLRIYSLSLPVTLQ